MGAPRFVRSLSIMVVVGLAAAVGVQDAFAQWTYRTAPGPLIRNITVFTDVPTAGTNTLIVSTLTNGMYKGTSNGATSSWQKISNGIPIVEVRTHATVSQTDFYAVTDGSGVYKTSDGGANWSAINGSGATALGCLEVRTIAVPVTTQPRTLIVSTSCRNNSGVYRSIDDGATWNRVGAATLPSDVQSSALNRSGNLYFLATANYGIFKSTDAGATWAAANSGISGTNVFSTVFSGASGTAELLAYVHGSGIYRSIDTGATWAPSNNGLPANFASLAGISRDSTSTPALSQTLYIGVDSQGVYRTTDGGQNWSAWGNTANDETTKFARTVVFDTPGSGKYYFGSLNGLKRTGDNAASINGVAMPDGGRINAITHDRDAPYVAYVTAHIPVKINYIYGDYNSDALFTPINGVTGATSEGAIYQDRSAPSTLYVTTNNRGIFKSTDGGVSSVAINNGLPANLIGQPGRLAVDPVNSQNLYLGLSNAAGVYKSTNGGASWVAANVGLSSSLAMSINNIVVDGNNSAIVWAATNAGLFKSTSSGGNWTLMYSALDGAGSLLPVASVRVRLGNSNEVYIANNHANADGTLTTSSGILRSANGGGSWTNILPNQPASQVSVTVNGDIYAGVSATAGNPALYLSTNGGTSFAAYSTGLQGSDIRALGFASDESALISLSLENGFYTNNAVPAPPTVALAQTITEAPNNILNLVFAPQLFGTTSATKSVTITNTGATPATILGFGSDNSTFIVQGHTCGTPLPPAATCTVNVAFAPNPPIQGETAGTLTAIGPVSGFSVKLWGAGFSPASPFARISLTPGAVPAYPGWTVMGNNFRELSFGNRTIGTSRTLSYTLTNFGGGQLNVSSIAVDNARFVYSGTCGATLAAGASCLIGFTYTPTTVGQDAGNVNVITDSVFTGAGQLNFSLTGVGETAGAEGSLISGFGDDGRVFISTGTYGQELIGSLAQQPDAKTLALVVARKIVDDGVTIPAVVRLNIDGSLDNTFGTGGIVRLPPPGQFSFDISSTVVALADGRILVSLNVANIAGTANDTYVYRLLSNGQIDSSFGTAGSTVIANLAHGLRLAADGKIVLGGLDSTQPANNALIFTRLTVDGAVDTSFGVNGRTDVFLLDPVQTGQGTTHLEIASDGKILFSYSYGAGAARDVAIYRLTAAGAQDTTWGTNGRVNVSPTNREDNLRVTRQQSDGKILLLTRTTRAAFPANLEFLLTRLNPDGALDSSFGTGGIVETLVATNDANGSDSASALRVLADGKIIVAGRRLCGGTCPGGGADLVVLRYLANGTLDPSFGSGGIKIVVLTRVYDAAYALNIDADGTIVIGGEIQYIDVDRGNVVGTAHIVKLQNTPGVALVNLTVAKVGSGLITSVPAGIDCGGTCVASVAPGTMLTLTATATMGSTFAGWSGGGCSGTGTCAVTVNTATTVTATFTGGPISLSAVQSRKTHGATGTYDLAVDTSITDIHGAVSVESRTIGSGHTIVFQFSGPVSSVGSVNSQDANSTALGVTTTPTIAGNEVSFTLTGVPDNRRAKLTVTSPNGGADVFAVIGFLVGDVNNTRSVNSSDISGVKARSGQSTTAGNFKFDVNATGAINSSDISAVKARSGSTLPP